MLSPPAPAQTARAFSAAPENCQAVGNRRMRGAGALLFGPRSRCWRDVRGTSFSLGSGRGDAGTFPGRGPAARSQTICRLRTRAPAYRLHERTPLESAVYCREVRRECSVPPLPWSGSRIRCAFLCGGLMQLVYAMRASAQLRRGARDGMKSRQLFDREARQTALSLGSRRTPVARFAYRSHRGSYLRVI